MKLFSEKVEPTFTSSNLNILGVKNFKEVFVDVFEFEINGKKFITEKVSEHNGLPVVNIPIVLEGSEYIAPFVLRRGQVEILFNKENATFVKPVLEEVQELIEQYTDDEQAKVQALVKGSIDELSNKLTASIEDKAANIESLVNEKILNLTTNTIPNVLKGIGGVSETIDTVVIEEKINTINETVKIEKEKIYADIETIASEATQLSEKIDKNTNRALSRIGNVKVQLEATIEDAITILESKLKSLESKISDYYVSKIAEINESVRDITESNKEHIIGLVNESKETLLEEISKIKSDIPDIVIENEDGKQGVNVAGIKAELEKLIGTKFTTEISALKRLIELSSGGGSVAMQFANGGTMNGNLTVKGAISASQYLGLTIPTGDYLPLSGGIVDGNVSVNGSISATSLHALSSFIEIIDIKQYELSGFNATGDVNTTGRYLSSGVDLLEIFTGGTSDNIEVNTVVQTNSANWDSAYNTSAVYQNNSASYINADYVVSNFLPLTGGSITGDLSAENILLDGNQVATVVDPVKTTITGNGSLSTFSISGASNLLNPSALIVAIDGAMQEPVVDYTVSNDEITFTSPLADGSKAVVISPSNTLQVSQMIPADGSVTSSKLDTNITVANNLAALGTENTLPNQTLDGGDASIITRNLLLNLLAGTYPGYRFEQKDFVSATWANHGSSGGSASNFYYRATFTTPATLNSFSAYYLNNISLAVPSTGRAGVTNGYSYIRLSKDMMIDVLLANAFSTTGNGATLENRNFSLTLGFQGSGDTTLANQGIGFDLECITNSECYLRLIYDTKPNVASSGGTITAGTPVNINRVSHNLQTGDYVKVISSSVSECNGYFQVTRVDSSNFRLDGVSSASSGTCTFMRVSAPYLIPYSINYSYNRYTIKKIGNTVYLFLNDVQVISLDGIITENIFGAFNVRAKIIGTTTFGSNWYLDKLTVTTLDI